MPRHGSYATGDFHSTMPRRSAWCACANVADGAAGFISLLVCTQGDIDLMTAFRQVADGVS